MIRPYLFSLLLLVAACNPSAEHKGTDGVSSGAQVIEDVVTDTVPNDGTSVDTSRAINDQAVDTIKPLETKTEKQVEKKVQQTTQLQSETEGKIKGTWQWSYTSCCNRMPKIIKDTSAQATLLKFNAGKVQQYHGKTFQSADTYTLTENDKGVPQIKFSKKNYPAYLNFKGDTLVISYGYMDLQTENYVRVGK